MPDLKKHFNNEAESFDSRVEKVTPRYDEMLEALINAIPDVSDSPRVLDLGCGTGNITLKVFKRFPNAHVTCLDLSENMLEIAKEKLADYDVEYVLGDFTIIDLIDEYDAIISSLALHHIRDDEGKLAMYKEIHKSLKDGGVFYNADIISASSKYNEELNNKISKDHMIKCGVTEEEITEHYQKRHSNDIPTTLEKHFEFLKEAGFKELDVIWKYYNTAVYGGTKK